MPPIVRDQAKIFVNGRPMRIETGEPLEDSVRTVHSVMLMYAERGGEPVTIEGHRGLKHRMNLTGIVKGLTMDLGENERKVLARMISQVFRATGAARCLRQADPHKNQNPLWFVAYELPDNFVVVVSGIRGKSAESMSRSAPTSFSEDLFLRPNEKRLLPEEVGETQPAGEVTVTTTDGVTTKQKRKPPTLSDEQIAERTAALEPFHEEARRKRAAFKERVYEYVVTSPVSLSIPEMTQLMNAEAEANGEETLHMTSYRNVVRELVDEGKLGSHKETAEERLVRGGGGLPKAKSPMLFHAPGPWTPRTRLPDGIEPAHPAIEHATRARTERELIDEQVYGVMDRPNTTGNPVPRTLGKIAEAADLPQRVTFDSLNRLVRAGRVFYNPDLHRYTVMSRVRSTTLERYGNGNGNGRKAAPELSLDEVETKIAKAMDVPNIAGNAAPRTPGRIADAAGLPEAETRRALLSMVAKGVLFFNPGAGTYTPMDRVHKATIRKWENQPGRLRVPPPEDTDGGGVAPYVNHPPSRAPRTAEPAVPADREALVVTITNAAEALAGMMPAEDMGKVEARITELEAENARLRDAVAGLKQTLAALS